MARGRYDPDRSMSKGLGGFIANDPKLQASMEQAAEQGKFHAESISPIDTGEYADSFHVSTERFDPQRVGALLYNDAPHAAHVEFDLTHTLAKTADHLRAKR